MSFGKSIVPMDVAPYRLSGRVAGEALCRHPDVGAISFIGSTATGDRVVRSAGMKKFSMELGLVREPGAGPSGCRCHRGRHVLCQQPERA
jgi:hypothetical protein